MANKAIHPWVGTSPGVHLGWGTACVTPKRFITQHLAPKAKDHKQPRLLHRCRSLGSPVLFSPFGVISADLSNHVSAQPAGGSTYYPF